MAELQIYDSQGERYDTSNGVEQSTRIQNFFFGGVRVYLDIGSPSELIVFFRARESKSGRAEQYYAVYRTDELRKLFDRFKADLRQRVEEEFGMTLQTTSDDVELFTKLDSTQKPVPGTTRDHQIIESSLQRGDRLRFGVSTGEEALGLFLKYIQGDATEVAIGESTAIDDLETCDLVIEVGSYDGLEPLGETTEIFEARRGTTGSHGGSSSRSERPRATAANDEAGTASSVPVVRYGILAGVLLVSIVVVGLLLVNVAAMMGYTTSAANPVVVVDQNPTLEDVQIEGEDSHALTEDGEFVDNVTVAPRDENNIVDVIGETNQDEWRVALHSEAGPTGQNGSTSLFDGEIDVEFSNVSPGEYELIIAAGDNRDGDDWPAIEERVTLHVEDTTTDDTDE